MFYSVGLVAGLLRGARLVPVEEQRHDWEQGPEYGDSGIGDPSTQSVGLAAIMPAEQRTDEQIGSNVFHHIPLILTSFDHGNKGE